MYFNYTSAQNYVRTLTQGVALNSEVQKTNGYKRSIEAVAGVQSDAGRRQGFTRNCLNDVIAADFQSKVFSWFRNIQEQINVIGETGRIGDYLRGIYEGCVMPGDTLLRGLIFFVKIATAGFARDYVLRRFLKSKDDIV
jgi:hypothetical protein